MENIPEVKGVVENIPKTGTIFILLESVKGNDNFWYSIGSYGTKEEAVIGIRQPDIYNYMIVSVEIPVK